MYDTVRALEKAVLLLLCSAMLVVCHTQAAAAPLYTALTRLHVIANSDSAADQALKLCVRDRVLAAAEPLTADAADAEAARTVLAAHLPAIQSAAQETVYANGYAYPVTVTLEAQCRFGRRDYDTFSLPAGDYHALRVKIGHGAGQNWWCVLFPPLCTAAATELPAASGLTKSQWTLISRDGTTYELRFWILDWLSKLRK